jgi:hypothetical protein
MPSKLCWAETQCGLTPALSSGVDQARFPIQVLVPGSLVLTGTSESLLPISAPNIAPAPAAAPPSGGGAERTEPRRRSGPPTRKSQAAGQRSGFPWVDEHLHCPSLTSLCPAYTQPQCLPGTATQLSTSPQGTWIPMVELWEMASDRVAKKQQVLLPWRAQREQLHSCP